MATDFEKIPQCVFDLFGEIMYADRINKTHPHRCDDKGNAWLLAWGWNPPLMVPHNETQLTSYGLAAWSWYTLRHEAAQADKPKGKGGRPKKGAALSCNDALMDLCKKKPEAAVWSLRQLSEATGFARSTIQDTPFYKELQGPRAIARAKREIEADKYRPR